MNTKATMAAATVLAALLTDGSVLAGESRVDFDFEASARADYDTNVGIAELDQNADTSDSVVKLGAGVDATIKASDHIGFRLGYDYSGSAYRRFSEFDLDLHHAIAEVSASSRVLDAALTAERFDGRLDGEPYLTVTQYSPSVSRLIADRAFLRGAWIASEKCFDDLPERNAHASAYRLDAYFLFDGMDRYLAMAWQSGDENAASTELDYRGRQAELTWGYRFTRSRMLLKTRIRFENRDYRNVTEDIGESRRDRRLRAGVTASLPIGEHFTLDATAARTLNTSNFEPAAIQKFVGGLELKAKF